MTAEMRTSSSVLTSGPAASIFVKNLMAEINVITASFVAGSPMCCKEKMKH